MKIYSDCKSALQALQDPRLQSGQPVFKHLLEKLDDIRVANGPEIQFGWVPAHADVEGNEKANTLSRSVTVIGIAAPPSLVCEASLRGALSKLKERGLKHWTESYIRCRQGAKYTRHLDKALQNPPKRTH